MIAKWDKTDTIVAKVVATGYADVGFDVDIHFSNTSRAEATSCRKRRTYQAFLLLQDTNFGPNVIEELKSTVEKI
jgi:hypothetical protein